MWEIEFYTKRNGKCPTQEFLDQELSPSTDLPFVINDLSRLEEHGNNLHRPMADYLGDDIYELRTRTMSGQIRLLNFFYHRNKIVISHGIKKEAKVPSSEIKKAVEYRKDYITQQEEKRRK